MCPSFRELKNPEISAYQKQNLFYYGTIHKAMPRFLIISFCCFFLCQCTNSEPPRGGLNGVPDSYEALEQFFLDWQSSLELPLLEGVPDYRETTMQAQYRDLGRRKKRLEAMVISDWPVAQQVDWYVVWSDMNAMIFAHRVKKPWQRDPAFYIWYTDATTNPGTALTPRAQGSITLEKSPATLSAEEAENIARQLTRGPALWQQARTNLTGDARDLWLLGEQSVRRQTEDLNNLARTIADRFPDLAAAARATATKSEAFADWLLAEADKKNAPSGVGELEYTWNLRNVHLMPYSWDDEKLLVEGEIAQALTKLRLEQDRNRDQPEWTEADWRNTVTELYGDFLQYLAQEDIRPVSATDSTTLKKGNWSAGSMRPWMAMAGQRNVNELSPIRQAHSTAMYHARMPSGIDDLLLQNALEYKSPRSRELAWMLLAQRAARAYGALHQHGLLMDHAEATRLSAKWTPSRLRAQTEEGELAQLEHQYLQQAGLGTSYVIGRLEVERLLASYAQKLDKPFSLRDFVKAFDRSGQIPLSLIYWEMTGDKSMLNAALEGVDVNPS